MGDKESDLGCMSGMVRSGPVRFRFRFRFLVFGFWFFVLPRLCFFSIIIIIYLAMGVALHLESIYHESESIHGRVVGSG